MKQEQNPSKPAEIIFNEARKEFKNAKNSNEHDGNYKTNYKLHEQEVEAASIFEIAKRLQITPNQVAEKYYIKPVVVTEDIKISIGEYLNLLNIEDIKKYSIEKNLPSFLYCSDGHHYITIALIPDKTPENKDQLSVVYINSYTGSEGLKNVGKKFAEKLAKEIKGEFIDKSTKQQYDNACGLSVASNIADVAFAHAYSQSIKDITFSIPQGTQAQKSFYENLGEKFFKNIADTDLDLDKVPANPITLPDSDKELVQDLALILTHANSSDEVKLNSLNLLKQIIEQVGENHVQDIIIPKINKTIPQEYLKGEKVNITQELEGFKKQFPTIYKTLKLEKLGEKNKVSNSVNQSRPPIHSARGL